MEKFSPLEKKFFRVITEHGRHWTWHRNLIALDLPSAVLIVHGVCTPDVTSVQICTDVMLGDSLRDYEIRMAGYDPSIGTPYQLNSYQGVQCRDIRTPPEPKAMFVEDTGVEYASEIKGD